MYSLVSCSNESLKDVLSGEGGEKKPPMFVIRGQDYNLQIDLGVFFIVVQFYPDLQFRN